MYREEGIEMEVQIHVDGGRDGEEYRETFRER